MTSPGLRCPHCGNPLRASSRIVSDRCPACGGTTPLPSAVTYTVPRLEFAADRPRRRSGVRPAARRRGGRDSTLFLAVAGVMAALFASGVGIALGVQVMRPGGRPDVKPDADPTLTAPAGFAAETVRRVQEAFVGVRCRADGGRACAGAGFFAGRPGFVVTDAHALGYSRSAGYQKPARVEVVIPAGRGAEERTVPAHVYGLDACGGVGLALLEVDDLNLPVPLPFGAAAGLHEADEVLVFDLTPGPGPGLRPSVEKAAVGFLRTAQGKPDALQIPGLRPGGAGGPIVNRAGQVVGVSRADSSDSRACLACPAERVREFVEGQFASGGSTSVTDAVPDVARPAAPRQDPALPGDFDPGATDPRPPVDWSHVVGGGRDPEFRDAGPAGTLLVGLDVGVGKSGHRSVVRSVRAIYRAANGFETYGTQRGDPDQRRVGITRLKAKAGYAVGAITVKAGLSVDRLSITFMRTCPDGRLDPADFYESAVVGDQGGEAPARVGGDGSPVVGIVGRANPRDVTGLGLIARDAR